MNKDAEFQDISVYQIPSNQNHGQLYLTGHQTLQQIRKQISKYKMIQNYRFVNPKTRNAIIDESKRKVLTIFTNINQIQIQKQLNKLVDIGVFNITNRKYCGDILLSGKQTLLQIRDALQNVGIVRYSFINPETDNRVLKQNCKFVSQIYTLIKERQCVCIDFYQWQQQQLQLKKQQAFKVMKNKEQQKMEQKKQNRILKQQQKQRFLLQSVKAKNSMIEILNQVDLFRKQRKQIFAVNRQNHDKKLSEIQKNINNLGIEIQFKDTDQYLKKCEQILNKKSKENNDYIQELLKSNQISIEEMIQKFSSIGLPRFGDKKCLQRVIDYGQTDFFEQNQSVGTVSNNYTFFSQEESNKFKKQFTQSQTDGEIDIIGVTPICILKGGFQKHLDKRYNNINKSNQKTNYSSSVHYSVHVGKGITLTQDSVKLKSYICQKYADLVKSYIEEGASSTLQISIKEFQNKYGFSLDLGTFVFGSTYELQNTINFQNQQTIHKVQNISISSLQGALQGAVFFEIGVGGGKGLSQFEQKTGSSIKSDNHQIAYYCSKKVTAHPFVEIYSNWVRIVTLSIGCWRILAKQTNKIPISSILKNIKNQSILLKKCTQPNKLQQFERWFTNIHNQLQQFKQVPNYNTFHIVLIGESGSGKSYFGNQLIGRDINEPFKVSTKYQLTNEIQVYSVGTMSIYDTPGICHNGFDSHGRHPRQLSELVNNFSDSKHYMYINCFILMIKKGNDLQMPLNRLISIYGAKVLRSTLVIFNCQSKNQGIQTLKNINNIKNIQLFQYYEPSFNYSKQLFYNYKFNLPFQTLKTQFQQYTSTKDEILHRCKILKIYDSESYQVYKKILELRELQEMNKQQSIIKKRNSEILSQKSQKKQEVINFYEKLEYFCLFHQFTRMYIDFGVINNGILWWNDNNGYNLFKTRGFLFMDQIQINYEKGFIQGQISCQDAKDKFMAVGDNNKISYAMYDKLQKVVIYFLDGKDGLDAFAQSPEYYARVKIYIDMKSLYQKYGQLRRGIISDVFVIRRAKN